MLLSAWRNGNLGRRDRFRQITTGQFSTVVNALKRHDLKRSIGCGVFLVCGALAAMAQTNHPSRPAQPVALVVKVGECESRIGGVGVIVSASVERDRSTIRIQFLLNHVESACEIDPTNAAAVAQLVQSAASELMKGNQSSGQLRNIEVDAFELEEKKLVEIVFHRGDSTAGEPTCRLWFDTYNALGLSRLIISGKNVADWLEPRLVPLE